MKKSFSAREAAVISLGKTENRGAYSNIELSSAMDKYSLSDKDREFFAVLYYGSLERIYTLDCFIAQLSAKPIEKLTPIIKNILRVSLYQLVFLDKIPDHAIVDEAVKLAHSYSNKGAAGFVNAILRNAVRQKIGLDSVTDKSAFYSYPCWMIELWEKAYGEQKAV
ncbi:MAG: hypothetical protein IJS90_09220 [Clostridia bacterium]|nr:hypothetical protein [Clostridia bacterium]